MLGDTAQKIIWLLPLKLQDSVTQYLPRFLFSLVLGFSGTVWQQWGGCMPLCLSRRIFPEGSSSLWRDLAGGTDHGKETYTGAQEKCEEEGARKGNCYGLTATPHSPSPCAAAREEVINKPVSRLCPPMSFPSHFPPSC